MRPPREGRAGRLTRRCDLACSSAARPAQCVPPQAAHDADRRRASSSRSSRSACCARSSTRGTPARRRARRPRLVTRSAVSLVFSLPLTYAQKIRQVAGVDVGVAGRTGSAASTSASATSSRSSRSTRRPTSTCIPEFVLSAERAQGVPRRPQGAIVGRKLADKYGWKVGDQIPLRGTIYPGTWTFTLRGIYDGAEPRTDESTMFFHWSTT